MTKFQLDTSRPFMNYYSRSKVGHPRTGRTSAENHTFIHVLDYFEYSNADLSIFFCFFFFFFFHENAASSARKQKFTKLSEINDRNISHFLS